MSVQIQLRRGTTAQNNVFTGANGELSVDTERKDLRLHDGVTPGGTEVISIETLKLIYPVGAIYIGTTADCPLSAFFGTWTLVSSNKALWTGDGTNANTTIEAGLPNITGSGTFYSGLRTGSTPDGAFYVESTSGSGAMLDGSDPKQRIKFDASRSSAIYGNSNTVQPSAYVVNVWRRTA